MNNIALLLSVIGLVLDMAGVAGLFLSTLKDLGKIHRPNYERIRSSTERLGGSAIAIAFDVMSSSIDRMIQNTNRENEQIRKRSRWWLFLIICGFTFQVAANVIQIYHNCSN